MLLVLILVLIFVVFLTVSFVVCFFMFQLNHKGNTQSNAHQIGAKAEFFYLQITTLSMRPFFLFETPYLKQPFVVKR
jgi:hypothetical protein